MLPVVMVTASGAQQRLRALEVGADDFITKPFDQAELMARVALAGTGQAVHDTIVGRRPRWSAGTPSSRAGRRTGRRPRAGQRLRRFLSPQIAGLIVETGDESFLESHRRDITTVFTDLRGFTAFAETAEPEETMAVLRDYHDALGGCVPYEGTLEHFAGDGLMVFFNDPLPCPDAPERAVRMAVEMRDRVAALADGGTDSGHDLGFGVGIAHGYATSAGWLRGPVRLRRHRNRHQPGARLCAPAATRQVLVSPGCARPRDRVETRRVGPWSCGASAARRGPRGHRHRSEATRQQEVAP